MHRRDPRRRRGPSGDRRARRRGPCRHRRPTSTIASSGRPARPPSATCPWPSPSGGSSGRRRCPAPLALAAAAGIAVFATGGIGGVHRGAELTGDISADLDAIAHHPVVTVCAGAKAFLDLGRTLEHLETAGVPVLGWRHDWFPAFYTRSSGLPVPHRVESAGEVAAVLANRSRPTAGVLLDGPRSRRPTSSTPAELDAVLAAAARRRRRAPASPAPPSRRSCSAASPRRRPAAACRPTSPSPSTTPPSPPRSRSPSRPSERLRPSECWSAGRRRSSTPMRRTLGWDQRLVPRTSPLRRTVTGPSSLTTITVAAGVVEAVAATRRVAHAAQALDARLGLGLGTSRTPSWRRTPSRVEHRGAVDLGEGVAQRREVGRPVMSSGGGGRQAHLETAPRRRRAGTRRIAPMPRAPRSWTANSSRVSSDIAIAVHRRTPSRRRSTIAIGGSRCHVSPSQRSTP